MTPGDGAPATPPEATAHSPGGSRAPAAIGAATIAPSFAIWRFSATTIRAGGWSNCCACSPRTILFPAGRLSVRSRSYQPVGADALLAAPIPNYQTGVPTRRRRFRDSAFVFMDAIGGVDREAAAPADFYVDIAAHFETKKPCWPNTPASGTGCCASTASTIIAHHGTLEPGNGQRAGVGSRRLPAVQRGILIRSRCWRIY